MSPIRGTMCTHMIMDRVHSRRPCRLCGRVPFMGWLYVCRQDTEMRRLHALSLARTQNHSAIAQDESDYLSTKTRLAESLNMSKSVINGIRDSSYTPDQIDILIAQKEHLSATLHGVRQLSTPDKPVTLQPVLHRPEPNSKIALTNLTPPPSATSSKLFTDSKYVGNSNKAHVVPICDFYVCHNCRPQSYDRALYSFESVWSDELPLLTAREATQLRVIDARILQRIKMPLSPWASEDHSPMVINCSESDFSSLDSSFGDHLDSEHDTHLLPDHSEIDVPENRARWPQASVARTLELCRATPESLFQSVSQDASDPIATPGRSSSTASSLSLPTPSLSVLESRAPRNVNEMGFDSNKPLRVKVMDVENDMAAGETLTEGTLKSYMPELISGTQKLAN